MDRLNKAAGKVKAAVHPNKKVVTVTERFNEAAEKAKAIDGKQTSNNDKLKLYALFKQADVGDCNTERPGLLSLDATGKAQWDAWKALEGKSKEDAMKEYADEVDRQIAAIAAKS
ncbi:unnamed protein product [Ascophyllum nodosum]